MAEFEAYKECLDDIAKFTVRALEAKMSLVEAYCKDIRCKRAETDNISEKIDMFAEESMLLSIGEYILASTDVYTGMLKAKKDNAREECNKERDRIVSYITKKS